MPRAISVCFVKRSTARLDIAAFLKTQRSSTASVTLARSFSRRYEKCFMACIIDKQVKLKRATNFTFSFYSLHHQPVISYLVSS